MAHDFSFASGANAAYLEALYDQFRADPSSVEESWRSFFAGYEFAAFGPESSDGRAKEAGDNAKVEAFINAYRRLGHLSAHLNPLDPKPPIAPDMTPEAHGLGSVDAQKKFLPANLPEKEMSFSDINSLLVDTYCDKIGADFRELNDIEAVTWLQDMMEGCRNRPNFDPATKRRVLHRLTQAEHFEQFLGRRYLGQKRFSLEGLESLIPMLDFLADDCALSGCEELCLGMAHRGRLNVLANFMNKGYDRMLKEFEGSEFNPFDIDGDVKYHKGFVSEAQLPSQSRLRLVLLPNPSHLEIVNPVVEGFVRARQFELGDHNHDRVVPLLLHGDAAFIGQGVVAETLNLSQLESYKTGGTIHIITNNQIGFTTMPRDSRSCPYSSEIAKMIRAPVLHVNADDPEAAVWCAKIAVAFRQKFKRDVVIDLIGYRRHGHNEGDEPAFTQPLMYAKIKKHPTVLTLYSQRIISEGSVSEQEVKTEIDGFKAVLQQAYEKVHGKNPKLPDPEVPAEFAKFMTYRRASRDDAAAAVATGVAVDELQLIGQQMTTVPEDFQINPKLKRLFDQRASMLKGDGDIDWGMAELLAFGSLAKEGHHVRLSGQDCGRGTFTSRHAVLFDGGSGTSREILNHLGDNQQPVHIINSPLSEQGVLGFEFGYSVASRDSLVCWEAQFGDFANGAQIIIDQFISASEAKWRQASGLVMMLPHGHEGQGPEHSSARPERFLQLCGNLNIQVVSATTPAQYFHVLRRQLHRDFRKPLVIMSPKSLLRHKLCRSPLRDFAKDHFCEVLDDRKVKDAKSVTKMIFCSGKLYYELLQARDAAGDEAFVPILRLEQLYPFPYDMLKKIFSRYPKLKEIIWSQEEPQNMGGWNFARGRFGEVLKRGQKLIYVGRKNSGTPAEGSGKAHEVEQQRIVNDALGLASGWNPNAKTAAAT